MSEDSFRTLARTRTILTRCQLKLSVTSRKFLDCTLNSDTNASSVFLLHSSVTHHNNVTNLIHFHFHNHFIVSWSSTCFGHQASIFRRHYTSSFLVWVACIVALGWLQFVYYVGYVIVIHNDTRSTKCQIPVTLRNANRISNSVVVFATNRHISSTSTNPTFQHNFNSEESLLV
jgi:hypothetical protein